MNINENSRFSLVPQQNNVRSKFDISTSYKTSFNVGDLVPFYYEEVLPGDTFTVDTNLLARMQPLVTPMMDDLYLDFYYFFVPNRIVWNHWKEFMGENTESAWYPSTEYNVPHVKFNETKFAPFGSISDYFGLPVGEATNYSASQLPFRAYCEIWNEWFRDENLQDPVLVDKGDSDVTYDGQSTYGGTLLKSNKYHDYFTSALPDAQKGPDVTIPINDYAPVYSVNPAMVDNLETRYPLAGLEVTPVDGSLPASVSQLSVYKSGSSADGISHNVYSEPHTSTGNNGYVGVKNLIADLGSTNSVTINALRLALATQSFYEKNARGGTRYRELIKSHFNVTSPDGRQQVPELLNYNRVDVNINQVVQQSESTSASPLGAQSAYMLTADADNSFTKSFTEHGMVIGVMTARYKHSYQQGINKRFSRRTMFDYYFPVFANLGEQPVFNKEIYVGTDDTVNNEVFGYQEAFSEYRYHPDIVTSEMRSNHPQSLDVWHLADYYENLPTLSSSWITEDKTNVDRVLAVTSAVSNQIFCDIYIKNEAVRVMPMYSIPGLPRNL